MGCGGGAKGRHAGLGAGAGGAGGGTAGIRGGLLPHLAGGTRPRGRLCPLRHGQHDGREPPAGGPGMAASDPGRMVPTTQAAATGAGPIAGAALPAPRHPVRLHHSPEGQHCPLGRRRAHGPLRPVSVAQWQGRVGGAGPGRTGGVHRGLPPTDPADRGGPALRLRGHRDPGIGGALHRGAAGRGRDRGGGRVHPGAVGGAAGLGVPGDPDSHDLCPQEPGDGRHGHAHLLQGEPVDAAGGKPAGGVHGVPWGRRRWKGFRWTAGSRRRSGSPRLSPSSPSSYSYVGE